MKKFENVDVIDTLQQIMRHNTAYYRNDFDIDKRILTRAAQSSSPEDKAFLWMSRPAGTHCLRERDVFLKDTREYNTFRFYAEQTSDKVLAYAVAITGIKNGKIMGNVYELDYREQAQKVVREALPADTHALIYENGTRHQPANYRFDAQPDMDFGKFERFEALPNDPDALQELLRSERKACEQLAPGEVRSHVAELSDRKVMDEAQRIADAFQKLPAPNSPNKTHFMVEVSQAFLFLASSKEQERLQAMLPYKSLYLSGMKDKRGIYALISKDENRSLPLRQPRRSVRSQLKDGHEKAAAPKKGSGKEEKQRFGGMSMSRIVFTVEEENLICIYHNTDRRRTLAGISDALQDIDEDVRQLAEQTIHKLHNMTDAAFEEAKFNMTLSDAE